MRRTLVVFLLALLVGSSAAAVAAPGRPPPGSDDDEREGKRGPAPIGMFVAQPGTQRVTGDHVEFNYSRSGIEDFRAGDRLLFDILVDGPGQSLREPRAVVEGPLFRVRTGNFTFTAHDNPSGTAKLDTSGRSTVTFEEGVVLFSRDERMVRFSFGDVKGALRAHDLDITGRTVVADGNLLLFLDTPRGSFDKHRDDIGHAIARGHVGAEATYNALDSSEKIQEEVVSYGNVTMTTLKAEKGNITLLIDGNGTDGRVLVFNLDGRVLGADSVDKLNILLNNVSVARASDLTDALDPDDDGFAPESYLVYDPQAQAFQLMLTVPHYSVHTLSVTTFLEIAKPAILVGVVLGLALLLPLGLVLFRRP